MLVDADKVFIRMQAEPGLGWSADALAATLKLDEENVTAALESLKTQGRVRRSVGGNWYFPKPPVVRVPVAKAGASRKGVHPDHLPGAQQVWLIHAPALAVDTVLHLSFKEGTGHYRLRRYAGGDPLEHGKGYEMPDAKTIQELRGIYAPFLREADYSDERPNYQAVISWRKIVHQVNEAWGIGVESPEQ